MFNTNVAAATSTEILRYEYALKDHLGNTRLTFTDKNGNGVVDQTNLGSTNEVIQESHYYPFGLDLPGFWINDGGALDNQYKYNGKELNGDFGLGWMDYGARWYDGAVGRWWSVDPLAEKYAGFSPYNYGVNNPVKFIDPDGKDGMIRYTEGKGTKDEPHIITIKANYYYNKNNLNSTQISALKSTINDYNSKESSSGKEKDGTYTIYKYELAEKETDSDEAALNMALGDVFVGSDGEDRQYGNVITTGEDDSALGFDLNGKRISLVNSNISKFVAAGNGDFSESDVTKSVLLHEIGHNLGGEHGDVQPMGDGHVEARYNKISPDCMGNCETKAVLTKASLNKNFARTLVDRAKNPNGRKYLEYSKQ